MLILSLNYGHDGSATLAEDGKIIRHVSSERVTGRKKERGFNLEILRKVMGDIPITDIDFVAIINLLSDYNPETKQQLFESDIITQVDQNGQYLNYDNYMNFKNSGKFSSHTSYVQINTSNNKFITKPAFFVDHHFCHCVYSYLCSPFDNALSVSVDVSDYFGVNNRIVYFNNLKYSDLGKTSNQYLSLFYSQICDFLGFYPSLTDAGKVMALAAYGDHEHVEKIRKKELNTNKTSSTFLVDLYTSILLRHGIKVIPETRVLYPQLKQDQPNGKIDPNWLSKHDWNEQLNKNIALDIQTELEQTMIEFIKEILNHYKNKNICFSGGTFLNCVMNGVLEKEFKDNNIFIAPAAGDDGLSIGAALFLSYLTNVGENTLSISKAIKNKIPQKQIMFSGITYDEKTIKNACSKFDLYSVNDYDVEYIAKSIEQGKIIAWFQEDSEIGPRALCHRSIIANPCIKGMKDILNKRVKKRESFRPFAPVVLREYASDWFDYENELSKEYMIFSSQCFKPDLIPSAVHIDGSARFQIIDKEINSKFCNLIEEFEKLTGVPILINTSFNVQGQPIVETPDQAVETFVKEDIDILVLENYVLVKKEGR